jgi:prepilin-type N-terminal cleavage/methylation domain-containing protein
MKRRQSQRGFTLLELMLTLTVTTIGLIGLLSLHLSIARGNDAANRSAEASQIANGTIEQLRAARITDMLTELGLSAGSVPPQDLNPLDTVTGRGGMTFRRRVILTSLSASTSLWLIRVEIGWTEDFAAQGAQGGILDHTVSAEVIRTVEEAL